MKKIIFISATIVFVFAACSKDDEVTVLSKKDMLTTGSWKLTASVSDEDGDGTFETNNYMDFEVCFTDNYYVFKNNGELELNEGNTKCDASDPQTETLSWQLTNNDNTLLVQGISYSVEELNNSTLKIKFNYGSGISDVETFSKR